MFFFSVHVHACTYRACSPLSRLKEIEASIQAGMVGGNLGDAEGLTDEAEIEDAMAKECEIRAQTIEH